jgi:hypothetical protein
MTTIRQKFCVFLIGVVAIGTSAWAETVKVSTLGTVGSSSLWTFSYNGVVTQPGPSYGTSTSASGSGVAVNVAPNGAWTGFDFIAAPADQSYWISTESDTLAPSSLISFDYQLSGLTVYSGNTIDYSFLASADNAVVGLQFAQSGNVIATLYSFNWQATPPPAPYFYGFQGSLVLTGAQGGVVAPPPISVQFVVLNEADNNVYTNEPTSPTGLAVIGRVTDVPLPSSLLAGSLLMGTLAIGRMARRWQARLRMRQD